MKAWPAVSLRVWPLGVAGFDADHCGHLLEHSGGTCIYEQVTDVLYGGRYKGTLIIAEWHPAGWI